MSITIFKVLLIITIFEVFVWLRDRPF